MIIKSEKIPLVKDTITKSDIDNLIEWLKTYPKLTKGDVTIEFEKQFANFIGTKYSVFVNSGSSANLLMLYSLIISNKLKNKKIVVPSISWATDLAPVIQLGLEPILVDCNLNNLAVDLNHLEEIFKNENPSAIILVSVLGLCPDMKEIINLCLQYNVILIEDNCESLGTKNNDIVLGSYGLMSSFSLYFGHHLSTIEGGMICTNDKETYNILKMLRSHGWDRDLDQETQKKYRDKINVDKFNSLYKFYIPGFNFRATDLQAFIGIEQLKKANDVFKIREHNFNFYQENLINNYWKPKTKKEDFICNFCYPIIHPKREEIVNKLTELNVEVRPLISGSMGYQPMYSERYGELSLKNSDIVHNFGMYVPNNQDITKDEILIICKTINQIIND